MPDSPGRAIVTFSRSWQALAVIRSLGRRGVEVICGDTLRWTPGSFSSFTEASFRYPDPECDPEGFLDALDAVIDEHAPEDGRPYVLLPVHRETFTIAAARERFAGRIDLALPSAAALDLVRDKGRLAEHAAARGVTVPRTIAVEDPAQLKDSLGELSYPAFVKVRTGVAGVGIQKVTSEPELLRAFTTLVEEHGLTGEGLPIVQQAATGSDYCVTALFDHGSPRATLTYRNTQKLNESGPGVVRETVAAPAAERAAAKLLSALEWHGIAQIDFIWTGDDDDEPVLIEVNPRFFGGLFQAMASGVDYPWLLYRLATDGTLPEQDLEVDVGLRTETPALGLLAALGDLLSESADLDLLEESWRESKVRFESGSLGEATRALIDGIKESIAPKAGIDALKRALSGREEAISQLMADEDPAAAVGLLYPLALFLRHGKVTTGLLVGAETARKED